MIVFQEKSPLLTEIIHENGLVLGAIVRVSDGRYYMAERVRNMWNSACLRIIADKIDALNNSEKNENL